MRTQSNGKFGLWLIVMSAAGGTLIAAHDYLTPGDGIDHTDGTLLVTGSMAVVTITAAIVAMVRLRHWVATFTFMAWLMAAIGRTKPYWLRSVLIGLLFLGLAGTGAASYLLESWSLVAVTGAGLIGWVIYVLSRAQKTDSVANPGGST